MFRVDTMKYTLIKVKQTVNLAPACPVSTFCIILMVGFSVMRENEIFVTRDLFHERYGQCLVV